MSYYRLMLLEDAKGLPVVAAGFGYDKDFNTPSGRVLALGLQICTEQWALGYTDDHKSFNELLNELTRTEGKGKWLQR